MRDGRVALRQPGDRIQVESILHLQPSLLVRLEFGPAPAARPALTLMLSCWLQQAPPLAQLALAFLLLQKPFELRLALARPVHGQRPNATTLSLARG